MRGIAGHERPIKGYAKELELYCKVSEYNQTGYQKTENKYSNKSIMRRTVLFLRKVGREKELTFGEHLMYNAFGMLYHLVGTF